MSESKLKGTERYLPFVPMVVLLTVAAFQAYNAREHLLSPWKGGGFGMFATADQPTARLVRVFLQNDSGGRVAEIPVRLPTDLTHIGRLAMSVRTMPRSGDTGRLAEALSKLPWRIFDLKDGQSPRDVQTLSNGGDFTIAPEGTRGISHVSALPVDFTAARVEVRRVKLNTRDWSISSELLAEAGAKR